MRVKLLGYLFVLALLAAMTPTVVQAQESEINKLLAERATAFLRGNRSQFLASVDTSSGDFLKGQELLFDRSRAITFAEYSLKLDEEAPFLTRQRDRQKFGPDTVVGSVEERLQVAGFDNQVALGRLLFTFVKKEGKWLIASDTPLDDLGLYSGRHPWDFGTVEAKTSEHFMLIVHPEDAPFASQLLSLAEQALPNVDRVYKRGWNKKVVIYVPATKRELERIIDATFEVDPFVAFASASVERDQGWVTTAPRIILNRPNFLRHTAAVQRTIFAHELLHIATRQTSGPFVSAFVEEGFAQTAETQSDVSFRRAFRNSDIRLKFPEDVEFVTGGSQSIGRTYNRAHSAFAFIQETFGIDRLNEFYVKLGSVRSDPGTTNYHLDAISRQILGVSLADLEAKWAAYVTSG